MSWTERQRAMLREMGIPPFWPVPAEPAEAPPEQVATPHAAAPNQAVRRGAAGAEGATQRAGGGRPKGQQRPPPAARPPPATPSRSPSAQPIEVPLGLRPVGVETMDWPALREAVASCQA